MKKMILSALLVAALAGCHKQTAQEAAQEQQQEAQEQQAHISAYQNKMQALLHICDSNGGVKDYWTGRGSINVSCMNGLQTNVYL
jgi:outer membrane biogenesis lipoprotein LolB